MTDLGPIEPTQRSGQEPFHDGSRPLGFDLLNFWQWSTSDLVSNTTRGVIAEYLVAQALEDPVVRDMVARRTTQAVMKGVDGVVGLPE